MDFPKQLRARIWLGVRARKIFCTSRLSSFCVAMLLLAGLMAPAAHAITLKVDRVTLNSPSPTTGSWESVSFRQTYTTTPVVFLLPSDTNPDPAALRIRNVTTTGFEVQLFEPAGSDGATVTSQIEYLAITPGVYTIAPGVVLEAGTASVSSFQSRNLGGTSWQALSFATTFSGPASLIVQIQGNANGTLTPGSNPTPWVTATADNVTATGADIALERSEVVSGTISSAEQIGYLAITPNATASFNDSLGQPIDVESLRSARVVSGLDNGCSLLTLQTSYAAPLAFGSKNSRFGVDGGWLRRCALGGSTIGVAVDEDTANDTERSHTTEEVGLFIASDAFDATLTGGAWEAGRQTLGGVGGVTLSFTQVTFPTAMSGTPLIFTQPTETDSAPATVRIRSVSASGFEVAAVEPPGSSGGHDAMTLDYIAVVPGVHQLANGTEFEAGFVDTLQIQRSGIVGGPSGWASVSFASGFTSPPAMLAQLQTTTNNEPSPDAGAPFSPWLTVAVSNLSAAGVQVALERSEVSSGTVASTERVGYFAFPQNENGTLTDLLGNTITYDTRRATAAAQGFDNGCFALSYNVPFASTPLAVGHGNTRNGGDGGWARRCAISSSAYSQHIDEDQASNAERSHISEDVSFVAFSQAFDWLPLPDIVLTPTLTTVLDGLSVADPKSVPGAVLENSIDVANQGDGATNLDSVQIDVQVPPEVSLFVGDLDGAGFPVVFVDGVGPESSGLTWNPASGILFSDDGGSTYLYTPPLGADFDPAVTHIRLLPEGVFLPATGTISRRFTIRYRFEVQ